MIFEEIPLNNYIKENLIGKRFGRLTVLYRTTNSSNNRARWACECDCGNIIAVTTSDLKNGHTKSCGCLKKELSIQRHEIDETNNRYGKLTVLRKIGKTKDRHTTWLCKCDCGNEIITVGRVLRSGEVQSCGCLRMSTGEYKIAQLLIQNHIPYIQEYTFPTCKFNDTNYFARFDFYVNNEYIIEYDGELHFKYTKNGWGNEQKLQKTKAHDEYKNNWCKEHNIPIIRIPYTHLKDLTIQDLQLSTSQFIVP